jgi:hypothetical protein
MMRDDANKNMKELTDRLWELPIGEYLVSEKFTAFRQEHDLDDEWREYLRYSQDRPDLYGGSVIKNTFSQFLCHIFQSQNKRFLSLFSHLLADFSRGLSCPLPVNDVKASLLSLGYPEGEIDRALFTLRVEQEIIPEPAEDCCTAERK